MIPVAKVVATTREIESVAEVLKSGQWASGRVVQEFEEAFAAYSGTRYAIAVSNGTVALEVAMKAQGVGPGTFVLTTPFTFIATSAMISSLGAIPVFIDIDLDTFLVDLDQLEDAIKKFRPCAASLVHLFGQPLNGDRIKELIAKHEIQIVEDCAQAQGACWSGASVGTFAQLGTHSFYATKNLPVGEGGMVVTSDESLASKVRRLVNHGRTVGYEHVEIGTNYRLTNIAAAIGKCRLDVLDAHNLRRRQIAETFSQSIQNDQLTLPTCPPCAYHVFHQYTIRCSERDRLKTHLESCGVGSAVVYPKTSYQQLAFSRVPHVVLGGGNAEKACQSVLSLPVHPELTDEQVHQIIDACNSFH